MASQGSSGTGQKRGSDEELKKARKKINLQKPQSAVGEQYRQKLLTDDDALKSVLGKVDHQDVEEVCEDYFPRDRRETWDMKAFLEVGMLLEGLQTPKLDMESLWSELLANGVMKSGNDAPLQHFKEVGFSTRAVESSAKLDNISHQLLLEPGKNKVPAYTAFSGASGSGKTSTMLHTQEKLSTQLRGKKKKCLQYYISCCIPENETVAGETAENETAEGETAEGETAEGETAESKILFKYVKTDITARLQRLLPVSINEFKEQCENTYLVLVLDEVQSRFGHDCYYRLPNSLEEHFHFAKVVLLVGSTAISLDVCQQPTADGEVLNIRMKPLREQKMLPLLKYHLDRQRSDMSFEGFVEKLFKEMPVLLDLMSNHRCAFLTAEVLSDLLGEGEVTEIPDGWGQGHSSTLVAMVACRYRGLNGLKDRSQMECRRLMTESLALLAVQNIVSPGKGVKKIPGKDSLAGLAKEVVEIGLVERAVLPDEPLNDGTNNVKVDGLYEFQMSPALTLVCVTAILPSIEGYFNPDDHFEALVATLMVAMRYAQTNLAFPIHRLERAVPYSGNEEHRFHEPTLPIKRGCFVNGPQAPYADLMVGGVEKGDGCPMDSSPLAKAISTQPGAADFPVSPLLVQCKRSSVDTAECNFNNELAKMGFVISDSASDSNSKVLSSPATYPSEGTESKIYKQYEAGKFLTDNWVKKGGCDEQVSIAFATNKIFKDDSSGNFPSDLHFMEVERKCEFAWQSLYPFSQLVREDKKYCVVGRKKSDNS